jgi:hypothetical protein
MAGKNKGGREIRKPKQDKKPKQSAVSSDVLRATSGTKPQPRAK